MKMISNGIVSNVYDYIFYLNGLRWDLGNRELVGQIVGRYFMNCKEGGEGDFEFDFVKEGVEFEEGREINRDQIVDFIVNFIWCKSNLELNEKNE